MNFEREYFVKFEFEPGALEANWQNVLRDLEIARKDKFAEVRFSYGYQALIKAGIVLLAYLAVSACGVSRGTTSRYCTR